MSKLSSGAPAAAANTYGIFTLSRAAFLALSGMNDLTGVFVWICGLSVSLSRWHC
jgi:hypothetical protein